MNINDTTLNDIIEFLSVEIGAKVLQGISYALIPKKDARKNDIEKYDNIRRALNKQGFEANQVFRRYELSEGYVYDLDLSDAVKLTERISKDVNAMSNGKTPVGDLGIRQKSYERHAEDMRRLCNRVVEYANKGVATLEVALFSRNLSNYVTITGKDKQGKDVAVRYDAYALRHTDIAELNKDYLSMYGLMVVNADIHEMLPSATGVRVVLKIAKLG